jgi:hypothetical protein
MSLSALPQGHNREDDKGISREFFFEFPPNGFHRHVLDARSQRSPDGAEPFPAPKSMKVR